MKIILAEVLKDVFILEVDRSIVLLRSEFLKRETEASTGTLVPHMYGRPAAFVPRRVRTCIFENGLETGYEEGAGGQDRSGEGNFICSCCQRVIRIAADRLTR